MESPNIRLKAFISYGPPASTAIHVIPNRHKWSVCKSRAKKSIRTFKNREVAFLFANIIAADEQYIIVHNQNAGIDFRTRKLLVGQILRYKHEEIKKL